MPLYKRMFMILLWGGRGRSYGLCLGVHPTPKSHTVIDRALLEGAGPTLCA